MNFWSKLAGSNTEFWVQSRTVWAAFAALVAGVIDNLAAGKGWRVAMMDVLNFLIVVFVREAIGYKKPPEEEGK